jgi:hypothetical protein
MTEILKSIGYGRPRRVRSARNLEDTELTGAELSELASRFEEAIRQSLAIADARPVLMVFPPPLLSRRFFL